MSVTPRGAGYGYVGGCVPERGGIVLSLERMNRIVEINSGDFVAVAESGVILKTLQDAVEKEGMYYPPDPASRADCSVGGTVATNAGGPRCLKYGVTRDYILGVKAVLADGTLVNLGGRTHKNKTGFDLTRLLVGSEGLLAIVTEVTVKLIPLPPFRALLVAGFDSMEIAARLIRAIFQAGFLPSQLHEIADQFHLEAARKRTGSERLHGRAGAGNDRSGWTGKIRAWRGARFGKARTVTQAGVRAGTRLRQRKLRKALAPAPAVFIRLARHQAW